MKSNFSSFPEAPGVYLMKGEAGQILYIGKAKNLSDRIKQYTSHHDTRVTVPLLMSQVTRIETIITHDEREALLLENSLIKQHKPKYNILLKDDKTFISLHMNTEHPYPQIKLLRYKEKGKGLYFGPYTSAIQARALFDTLLKLFPLRQCSDHELTSRKRPCLLYSIKRCLAPCVHKCTDTEYEEAVTDAISFLRGHTKSVLSELKKKMAEASKALQYEKAGALLSMIRHIEHIEPTHHHHQEADAINFIRKEQAILIVKLQFRDGTLTGSEHFDFPLSLETDEELLSSFILQHYTPSMPPPKELCLPLPLPHVADIVKTRITVMTDGIVQLALDNAKALYDAQETLLSTLQETLQLTRFPARIECIDTSHIAGSDPVASLVAFTDGAKDPKRSRLYKLSTGNDDYASLREVLSRRIEKEDLPDLLIVDGGKGHLHIAQELFPGEIIAFVKEEGRHDKGLTKERIFHNNNELKLHPHSPLLFFLQTIRDEAHRRAIQFHRKRRTKRTIISALDKVPGIGPIKKKRLLSHFGSVKGILKASEEELLTVISKKDLKQIKTHLHPDA